mmetsp:Transcript_10996/g.30413  ORF Transcript_10996/g.30413 Transcript_10996/m.30413 type:complete len:205 (-) Transcript_10996:67-681(-)
MPVDFPRVRHSKILPFVGTLCWAQACRFQTSSTEALKVGLHTVHQRFFEQHECGPTPFDQIQVRISCRAQRTRRLLEGFNYSTQQAAKADAIVYLQIIQIWWLSDAASPLFMRKSLRPVPFTCDELTTELSESCSRFGAPRDTRQKCIVPVGSPYFCHHAVVITALSPSPLCWPFEDLRSNNTWSMRAFPLHLAEVLVGILERF